jgi:hypothetical protein
VDCPPVTVVPGAVLVLEGVVEIVTIEDELEDLEVEEVLVEEEVVVAVPGTHWLWDGRISPDALGNSSHKANLYQSFEYLHTYPETHVVAPVL